MILARLRSPTLTTLQSLRMMVARPTLLLLVPDVMLKLQPETERTRLLAKESARRFQTVKEPFQTQARADGQNDERISDISDLKTKMI